MISTFSSSMHTRQRKTSERRRSKMPPRIGPHASYYNPALISPKNTHQIPSEVGEFSEYGISWHYGFFYIWL